MRRLDDTPIDPDIADALDAIDATLAGDPVDPRFAELAELALLLQADRPELDSGFALELEAKVERRFAPEPGAGAAASSPGAPAHARRWPLTQLAGIATAAVAAVVAVVVLSAGGSGPVKSETSAAVPAPVRASTAAAGPDATAGRTSPNGLPGQPTSPALKSTSASGAAADQFLQSATASAAGALAQQNNRKVVQASQLSLTTAPSHVDQVAQEIFNVIGAQNGFVNHSTVTATNGADGYAELALTVPSGNLPATMTALSRLKDANVASRTDNTEDVTGPYTSVTRRLAEERALRSSLLTRLANATTQQQIDSLKAQIHDQDVAINRDEATLSSLGRRVAYSSVMVTINAVPVPVSAHHSGTFTLGKAAHDAGRVLTVAAGVALITLAVLVPLGLLAAIGLWIAVTVRRRRREQALDLA